MKLKSLFTVILTLSMVGLSLPALAGEGDRDGGGGGHSSSRKKHQYYGNYYPYKNIYIGSKGDYFDREGKHHFADENPEYRQFFNRDYDYKRYGNYYDEFGKYYKANRGGNRKYFGKYHFHKTGNSYIYIGQNGDYFDRDKKYHDADENPEYRKFYNRNYKYDRYGNYFDESGKYYDAKRDNRDDNRDDSR